MACAGQKPRPPLCLPLSTLALGHWGVSHGEQPWVWLKFRLQPGTIYHCGGPSELLPGPSFPHLHIWVGEGCKSLCGGSHTKRELQGQLSLPRTFEDWREQGSDGTICQRAHSGVAVSPLTQPYARCPFTGLSSAGWSSPTAHSCAHLKWASVP